MESKSSILSLTLGDHQRCYVAMAAVPHMNLLRPISVSAADARLYLVICHPWPAVPPACQLLSLTNAFREFYFLDMPGNGARRLGGYKKGKTKLENHYRCKIERAIFKGWWQHTTCIQSSFPIRWVQFVAQHFFSLVALAGPLVRLPNLLASTAWSLQNRSKHK